MRFHVRALLAIGGFIVATSPAVSGQNIDSVSLQSDGTTASLTGVVSGDGGGYVSILACRRDAEAGANAGPTVAYFERTEKEVAACMTATASDAYCAAAADIADGMPCAKETRSYGSSWYRTLGNVRPEYWRPCRTGAHCSLSRRTSKAKPWPRSFPIVRIPTWSICSKTGQVTAPWSAAISFRDRTPH